MGGAVILPCSLHEGQTMVWVLATSFKRTYTNTPRGSQHYCIQWPRPHSRPLSTHTSTGDSQAHTGKSGSVCCGVTAPFSQVLVCTRSCLGPQESVFPSPGEFLQSNLTGLHSEISCGFSDICWVPGWEIHCGSLNYHQMVNTKIRLIIFFEVKKKLNKWSHSVVSDSLWPCAL